MVRITALDLRTRRALTTPRVTNTERSVAAAAGGLPQGEASPRSASLADTSA